MAFAPYVTSAELLHWADVAGVGKADIADSVVIAATRAVDEYCQRHFWQDGTVGSPVARTFDPSQSCPNCSALQLGVFNDLASINTLKTDATGDGVFETTWSATDYQLRPPNRPTGRPYTEILAVGSLLFPASIRPPGRPERVEVAGVWGWPTVPEDVVVATEIKAARLLTRPQSINGVAGVNDFGPIRISQFEDPDVIALLAPYRHPTSVVLVA